MCIMYMYYFHERVYRHSTPDYIATHNARRKLYTCFHCYSCTTYIYIIIINNYHPSLHDALVYIHTCSHCVSSLVMVSLGSAAASLFLASSSLSGTCSSSTDELMDRGRMPWEREGGGGGECNCIL